MTRARTGFTLLELLIVVMILGIIAGMVIPMVSGSQDAQCAAAARALTADLETAQSTALARQAEVALVFSASLQSYKVVLSSGQDLSGYASLTAIESPSKAGRPYEVTLASEMGLRDLVVQSASFGGPRYVVFDTFGSPAAGGSVVLRAGDASLTVTVEAITGAVTVN